MKKPVTVRVDPELLAAARRCAREENRTLTNFIETVLRQRIASSTQPPNAATRASKRSKDKPQHAA